MKKIIAFFLSLAVSLSLAGCAGNPGAVPDIPDEASRLLAAAEEGTGQVLSGYEAPGEITGELTLQGYGFPMTMDAEVILPKAKTIPVCRITPRAFTEDEAQTFVKVLAGVQDFVSEEVDGFQIAGYARKLSGGRNTPFYIRIRNGEDPCRSMLYSKSPADLSGKQQEDVLVLRDWKYGADEVPGEGRSKEIALNTLEALGFGDYVLDSFSNAVMQKHMSESSSPRLQYQPRSREGFEFTFVRQVGDLKLSDFCYDGRTDFSRAMANSQWPGEVIRILVSKSGLESVEILAPCNDPEILVEDARLLPFDEILSIFEAEITGRKNVLGPRYVYDQFRSAQLKKVELRYMRVDQPGNDAEALLIPVWDFTVEACGANRADGFSGSKYTTADSVLVTVSAIDGTVIDRFHSCPLSE